MPFPLQHLPVLQNWDCHARGTCCKEYLVTVTDEERKRIEAQGWDKTNDLEGREPFKPVGPPWARKYQLNHRPDGSCVFLSEQGRCRIHERFGYETKPLPCRLFPFVLVPAGDHWRVGMRFACPSAADNLGRPMAEHQADLSSFAEELARREKLMPLSDGAMNRPPPLHGGRRLPWPDTLRVVDALTDVIRNRKDPLERRLRKALALGGQLRKAHLAHVTGGQLGDLLTILRRVADEETEPNLMRLPPPGWVGRVLFRQAVALYTRKDHGPNRGVAGQGRLALLGAAWRFARGRGPVPRMHRWLPETTFERVEKPVGPWPLETDHTLERYYAVKVGSLQFCGPAAFGMSLLEGFEALVLTYPVLMWVARAFADRPRDEAVRAALSIVDDHFGFNRVMGTARQRGSFQILARTGELAKLVGWYSR